MVLQEKKSKYSLMKVCLLFVVMFTLFVFLSHNVQAAAKVYMKKGQSMQLRTGATQWKSKKKKVARVTSDGYVYARKKGSAKITCKVGNKKFTYKVYVEDPKLTAYSQTINAGSSFTLKIKNTSKKYNFTSSNPSVATVTKKSKKKMIVKGLSNGTAAITGTYGNISVTCYVTVINGTAASTNPTSATSGLQTLYMDGNVFKEMTWNRSSVALEVSSVSSYGQSAPLYIHKDGGDGLENIWAATNNGAVEVPGAQLSAAEIQGTVDKACAWASAVCNSPYHGYDMYAYAPWGEIFGQAKANALGTGDYTCFSIPLCAYYFAGVNVLGENLGGPNATYIPNTTLLWYTGYVSFWDNGQQTKIFCPPYADWKIYERCGFTNVVKDYKKDRKNYVFQKGDVLIYQSHAQMVVKAGTLKTARVAQAHGYGKDKKHIGGDQGSELTVSKIFRKKDFVWIMRFTGQGVKLNTVGLNA